MRGLTGTASSNGASIFLMAGEKMRNIVLMGFAGTGKTVIGRTLAALLRFQFVETDELLKSVTGFLPPELLKKHGARRFFSEQELLYTKLAQKEAQVITVGSLVPSCELLRILCPSSIFVFLECSAELLYKRLSKKNNGDYKKLSLDEFSAVLCAHEAVCISLCDIRIKTDSLSVDECAHELKQRYLDFLSRLD